MSNLIFVGVKLPASIIERIDNVSELTHSNRSQVIRHALTIGLAALESISTVHAELNPNGDVIVFPT